MNEEMKAAWLEISQMLGEPTREELDVFLRTWQRASQATSKALAEQPAQQCKWPTCQSEEFQQALAEQIKCELVGEQPARPYRLLQDNGSKYFGESWDKAEQPAHQEPYGQVTVVRRPGCVDQHWFYRWPELPYLDNAAECHTVYTSPPAQQQEPVAKVCHDLDGHIGWNPNLRQLPDEGTALYTSPPTLSLAQRPHECSRSHPHENMNAMCELRTEIARLTNENARLKAMHQDDEINTYRMTLLCIRDGLQQGMSKSIQKLQAREINDVLGLPSFASYRTSPPAQRKPLTEEEIIKCWGQVSGTRHGYVAFARAIEAAHGIKENT